MKREVAESKEAMDGYPKSKYKVSCKRVGGSSGQQEGVMKTHTMVVILEADPGTPAGKGWESRDGVRVGL